MNKYLYNLLIKSGRKVKRLLGRDSRVYLRNSDGFIHVSANAGQERGECDNFGLHVIWIEPIEEIG